MNIGSSPGNVQSDVVLRIVLDDGTGSALGVLSGGQPSQTSPLSSGAAGAPSPAGQSPQSGQSGELSQGVAASLAAVAAKVSAADLSQFANGGLGTDLRSAAASASVVANRSLRGSGADKGADYDSPAGEGAAVGPGAGVAADMLAAAPAIERLVGALDRNTTATEMATVAVGAGGGGKGSGGGAGTAAAAAGAVPDPDKSGRVSQASGQVSASPAAAMAGRAESIAATISQVGTLAARATAVGEGVGGSTAAALSAVSEAAVGFVGKMGAAGAIVAGTTVAIAALGYAANQTASRLSQYSPEISAAQSMGEVRTMMSDVRAAGNENLTNNLATMTEKMTDMNLSITELGRRVIEAFLPLINAGVTGIKVIADVTNLIVSILHYIVDLILNLQKVMNPIYWIKVFIAYWRGEELGNKAVNDDPVNEMERFLTGQTNTMPDFKVHDNESFIGQMADGVDYGRQDMNDLLGKFDPDPKTSNW